MAQTESTRCPHCHTAFRVTSEQLAAARGAVRCGSCLKVFNAREHPLEAPAPVSPHALAEHQTEAAVDSPFGSAPEPTDGPSRFAADDDDLLFGADPEDETDELVFMDDDEDDEPEAEDIGLNQEDSFEFSDSFLELEESTTPAESAAAQDRKTSSDAAADDSWALDMLADLEKEEQAGRPSHHQDMRIADEQEPEPPPLPTRRRSAATEAEYRQLDAALAQQDLDDLAADESAATTGRAPWIALSLLAVLALVLQFAWWERHTLSHQPALGPLYSQACQWLPCALQEQGPDAGAIRALSSVLRPLPDGRMRLDAVFVNRSERPLPFPLLQLSIQDSVGETVADGLFAPEDYVGGELQPNDNMPAGRPISISININQPVEDLNNFRLTFHY